MMIIFGIIIVYPLPIDEKPIGNKK